MVFGLGPSAVLAAGPADLFWQPEVEARAEGGADVPGQIAGRPQVRRPTSLAAARQGLLRLGYASQTPLELTQAGVSLGEWRSTARSAEYILPLGKPAGTSRWTLGVQRRSTSDRVSYAASGHNDRLSLTNEDLSLAVAWEGQAGWIWGATLGKEDLEVTSAGAALADWLKLPPTGPGFPRLLQSATRCDLAVSRQLRPWQWGLQYSFSRPEATLLVSRGASDYAAPLAGDARRYEAYVARSGGSGVWFASGWNYRSRGAGSVLVGLLARGDTELNLQDSSVAWGWRKTRSGRPWQVVLDRRWSAFDTYDQGYAGLLPGISAAVYTLRGSGHVTTTSLRYGGSTPVAGAWSLCHAVSAHYSRVDVQGHLRRVDSLGSEPVTVAEYGLSGGTLMMLAVSLGPAYEAARLKVTLLYTGGLAEASGAFSGPPAPPGVPGPARKVEPRPLLTAGLEYSF